MMQELSLGYSTCPNDTFVFHAMTHERIDCDGIRFRPVLKDVETLNQGARQGIFDVTKLSFAAIGQLRETYGLLRSGAALGRGCGPLIVSKPGRDLSGLARSPVAVPGLWTTANLLLGLYLSTSPEVVPMTFDKIMPAVAKGDFDYGVIIHEGRFTFASHGLISLLDLGQWWEDWTGLPIPLGGIAIRRKLGAPTARKVESIIYASVRYALLHPRASRDYIKIHAQEMTDEVIDQHISLYVNDDTMIISDDGVAAIEMLFEQGRRAGMIPARNKPLFAS